MLGDYIFKITATSPRDQWVNYELICPLWAWNIPHKIVQCHACWLLCPLHHQAISRHEFYLFEFSIPCSSWKHHLNIKVWYQIQIHSPTPTHIPLTIEKKLTHCGLVMPHCCKQSLGKCFPGDLKIKHEFVRIFFFWELHEIPGDLTGMTPTQVWVNTGSGNGLLPDGTKPSPEPILTSH